MGRVIELPEEVVRKISAGEVVVGAFSVVKELVENSLDAGAKRIEIEIKNGGKSYIRVSDDGEGMELDEMILAIKPHTTSKIKTLDDLYRIRTYGFRGEALSSIAEVSRMEITSRKKETVAGNRIHVVAGKVEKIEKDLNVKVGTTVKVFDLFFNVPARRKFLKSASIEGRMVTDQVQKFALSRPDVHVIYVKDGKVVYNLPPVDDLRIRIGIILPDARAREMVEFSKEIDGVKVWGFASKPGVWRKTRTGIYTFVNGRYVLDENLMDSIEAGYGESLPKGRHPIAVVFLEIPPDDVDVNVHPQKLEVKFKDPRFVRKIIEDVVSEALKFGWKRSLQVKKERSYEVEKREVEIFREVPLLETETEKIKVVETSKKRYLMVLRDRYLVFEDENGLLIIDYHAAHERLIYEDLKGRFKDGLESNYLVSPIEFEIDDVSRDVLSENVDVLERLGFRFELNGNILMVKAIPKILPVDLVQETVFEIVEELRLGRLENLPEVVEKILSDMACKRALRTGDKITPQDAEELLNEIEKKGILSCPHGRPVAYLLSYDELDRYFERR